jgi:hypothetical protein
MVAELNAPVSGVSVSRWTRTLTADPSTRIARAVSSALVRHLQDPRTRQAAAYEQLKVY